MNEREPGHEIAQRDELLQLLYWMEGEGFPGGTTLPAMARFLTWPEAEVRRVLQRLVERDEVGHEGDAGYRLTPTGRAEAGRRFAEEFSPLLAQGHGECNDPECECRTEGPAACRTHDH